MTLRKQSITIQASQIDSALTDFPVLIARDHLDDEIVDPSGGNAAQADGGDLIFYSDSALTNRLPCEVVQFEHDSSTGAGDADIQVWVKVPSISASVDTDIWVTYNEPGTESQPAVTDTYGRNAVWSSFDRVLHLEELPSGGTFVDSTGNGNDGTTGGVLSDADSVTCVIGIGIDFDQTQESINIDDLGNPSEATLECLGYHKSASGVVLFQRRSGFSDPIQLGFGSSAPFFNLVYGGVASNLSGATDTSINSWYHLAGVFSNSGGFQNVYLDGSEDGTRTPAVSVCPGANRIGGVGSSGIPSQNVRVDEVRWSTSARSAAWLAATSRTCKTPGTFAVAGTPEDAGGGGVAVEPDDCVHSHSCDSPTLTQTHGLVPSDCVHGHAAESPTLGQTHDLAPDEAVHSHAADAPTLTQTHVLVPAAATHGQSCDSPTLAQTHALAPSHGLHGHAAESPSLTETGTLSPDAGLHAHAADSPTITQVHVLVPAACLHAHVCESPQVTLAGAVRAPGLEYSAAASRLHYRAAASRLQYAVAESRLHYRSPEDP